MIRRDIGTDDPRVRIHPGRGSRPRTKQRPSHIDAALGMITRINHDHYRIRPDDPSLTEGSNGSIIAIEARGLGRGKVIVGDRVAVVGDTSDRRDTLACMVHVEERTTLLRRSAEGGDAADTERPIVVNAAKLVIIIAVVDPESRPRIIDRYLVATYDAGMKSLIVLTRNDLADAAPLAGLYSPLGVRCPTTRLNPCGLEAGPSQADDKRLDGGAKVVRQVLDGIVSVPVDHSGADKPTLIDALMPKADCTTGHANEVIGRGRHTSTSLQTLELPGGGRVIDTLGVRSFGIPHVGSADVLRGFLDLVRVAEDCPRGCTHEDGVVDCALDEWASATDGPDASRTSAAREERRVRAEPLRRLLAPSLEAEGLTRL